ncbi:hypothetical protein BSL78_07790 [Apostichopus japonicus]|uniref:LIM zinc-binding domain-containing protein n=1 Tax=Stichopus japonicus TaxID=307972 RepID=A0A2G8L503_STIJA|nr:hypothetical protein BSL78_07790 [Apostichopus japonicus]
MDKIAADGRSYHKTCFRCAECKKVLNLGTFAQLNSVTFCKPHFKQRFKLHGNYDFSANNLRSGSSGSLTYISLTSTKIPID